MREESQRRDPVLGADTGEGPSLLQIPLCVTAGPSEEEDPSLHRPALADATCDLDRRPRNEGARPKTGPRFSTQTIAEEARALQGGTDFYLPLPGQPKVSEVSSWRAPIRTKQGNPGIYVQVDEWKDKYGGNVYVVDEVTGRIYVLRGDVMERVPEVASRRRREDMEVSGGPQSGGRGVEPKTPNIQSTPVPVAESTRQTHPTPSSDTLRVDQEGLAFAGLAEVTQIQRPSPPRDRTGPEAGPDSPQTGERGGGSSRDAQSREGLSDRSRQITLLRDHVSTLRRERDRIEATLLNQHIYQARTECEGEDALEDLRDATQEEYARLLERELQPTLDYFKMIDEELIKAIPLEEEEDPNFDYPRDYDWKEGDYMWLLFKIQQHFAHREIWNGVYGFLDRTQPQRKARSQQAMVELTETWQNLFDKAVRVKRRAQRYLNEKKGKGHHGNESPQPPPLIP